MAMTPYSGDTSVIGKLGTTPQERGLTTQQFKDKFDEGLKTFVEWFNDVHKTEFDTHLAGNRYRMAQGVNDLVITTEGDFKYVEGAIIRFCASNTNTGAVTLNVDGKGVRPLKNPVPHAELPPGRLKQYHYYEAIYDSFHDCFFIKASAELNSHLADMAAHGISHKNLLHNWDFRNPVNQRGQSSYSGVNIYSIDRWIVENGVTLIVNDGYITIKNASGTTNAIRQDLENGHIFNGKTLTLSVCIKGVYRINLYRIPSGGGAINLGGNSGTAVDWEIRTVTATVSGLEPSDKLRVYIRCNQSGGSVLVQCAKLELGSVSTLANDPPADYREQLVLCKNFLRNIILSPDEADAELMGNGDIWIQYEEGEG